MGLSVHGKAFHEAISSLETKYGDLVCFRVLFRRLIIVSRVDYVEHILSSRKLYDISDLTTQNFSLLFPNGLLSLKGEAWKRHARLMVPVFRRSKILIHFDTIIDCIDHFINENFVNKKEKIHKDLVEKCQHVLLRIIARIAFNYDFLTLPTIENENVQKSFNDMIHCASQFALMTAIPLWIAKLILKFNLKFQKSLKQMKYYVMIIINQQLKRQNKNLNEKKSLINSLIESSQNDSDISLNSNDIFDEISMSILAGFETTSTALSWFIFYISKYPNVQQKIKNELKEFNLMNNSKLNEQILEELIYIDCVTKEILRFAPIAAGIVREAIQDDIIDGYQIKKGDVFLIAIQNLHQNPKYWKIDPNLFYPERWLNEDQIPLKYSYLPFGGGHRQCIGKDLAILELKIAITRLMQRLIIQDTINSLNNSGGFIQRVTCYPKHMAVRIQIDPDFNSEQI